MDIAQKLFEKLDNSSWYRAGEIQSDCPFCGKSKSGRPHFFVNLNKGVYYCFRCQSKGSIKQLLKELGLIDCIDSFSSIKRPTFRIDYPELKGLDKLTIDFQKEFQFLKRMIFKIKQNYQNRDWNSFRYIQNRLQIEHPEWELDTTYDRFLELFSLIFNREALYYPVLYPVSNDTIAQSLIGANMISLRTVNRRDFKNYKQSLLQKYCPVLSFITNLFSFKAFTYIGVYQQPSITYANICISEGIFDVLSIHFHSDFANYTEYLSVSKNVSAKYIFTILFDIPVYLTYFLYLLRQSDISSTKEALKELFKLKYSLEYYKAKLKHKLNLSYYLLQILPKTLDYWKGYLSDNQTKTLIKKLKLNVSYPKIVLNFFLDKDWTKSEIARLNTNLNSLLTELSRFWNGFFVNEEVFSSYELLYLRPRINCKDANEILQTEKQISIAHYEMIAL